MAGQTSHTEASNAGLAIRVDRSALVSAKARRVPADQVGQAGMADDDALGHPGRAGGEHDVRRIERAARSGDLAGSGTGAAAQTQVPAPASMATTVRSAASSIGCAALVTTWPRPGARHQLGEPERRVGRIERDVRGTGSDDSQRTDDHGCRAGCAQRDPVAGADPAHLQHPGQGLDLVEQIAVRQRRVRRVDRDRELAGRARLEQITHIDQCCGDSRSGQQHSDRSPESCAFPSPDFVTQSTRSSESPLAGAATANRGGRHTPSRGRSLASKARISQKDPRP